MIFYLLFHFISGIIAQNHSEDLYFKNDSTYKIVQFTDIHWVAKQAGNDYTLAMMSEVLDAEKPDMVVFTGDIVLSKEESKDDLLEGWEQVTKPVRKREINWVAVLGNHDSEGKVARKDVYNYIRDLKFNLNPENEGDLQDFCLPVLTKDKKIGSVIYLFDSNDYPESFMPGKYAWITDDQIENYKDNSNRLTLLNQGQPIPSLAFFHIPIPEYKELYENKDQLVGHVGEGISSPEINSGLFSAMVLQGDVMGVFCGHDHNNDFIGELQHIALAFGRCSGNNAYGDYRNGARVITLHPNQFSFDTWIRIPSRKEYEYHFPAGFPVVKDYLPAINGPSETIQGVHYSYYEGELESVSGIDNLSVLKKGEYKTFDITHAEKEDHFAYTFDSYIQIPAKDAYTFYLKSDDGSQLYIDDRLVVDNDGGHSTKTEKGHIGLDKGFHQIKVLYFEDYMGQELEVGIESSGIQKSLLHPEMLFIEKE